jgi:hypothetical protein
VFAPVGCQCRSYLPLASAHGIHFIPNMGYWFCSQVFGLVLAFVFVFVSLRAGLWVLNQLLSMLWCALHVVVCVTCCGVRYMLWCALRVWLMLVLVLCHGGSSAWCSVPCVRWRQLQPLFERPCQPPKHKHQCSQCSQCSHFACRTLANEPGGCGFQNSGRHVR